MGNLTLHSEKDLRMLQKPATNEEFIWKIVNSDLKRVHEYQDRNELLEVLGQQIDKIMLCLGIKKNVDQDVANKIVSFTHTNLGYLYPCEIEIAFDLALLGKINVDLKHFHDFNLMYYTSVMNPYVKYRSDVIAKARKEHQKMIDNKPSAEETLKQELEFLVNFWNEFMQNGWMEKDHRFNYIYTIITKNKIKADIFENKSSLHKKYLEEARPIAEARERKKEKDKGVRGTTDMTEIIKDLFDPNVYNVARELVVKQYFERMKEKNINIQSEIELWQKK